MPIRDDDARKAYFRDYMRKRRAGIKPEPKPIGPRAPTAAAMFTALEQLDRWTQSKKPFKPPRRPQWADKVLEGGVDLETDEGRREAYQRYQAARAEHRAALEAEREAEARQEAQRKIKRCTFCGKPQSDVANLWGDESGYPLICDQCLVAAIKDIGIAEAGQKR
jgi:hypothetical protein